MKIDKTFEERVPGVCGGGVVGHWFCQVFSNEKPSKIDVSKKKPKIAYC